MGRLQDALNYFIGKGYSREQSAGIVGNLHGESGLDIGAIGDGGKAYGLAQWHPDRQNIFKKIFGIDIRNSSFEQQLAFVDYELRNNESRAGRSLRASGSVSEATAAFMRDYERPASMNSLGDRVAAAMRAIGGGDADAGATGTGESEGSIGSTIGNFIADNDPTGISGFLRDLFTGAMAARFVAVFIGIILITVALAAFVLMSDTGKAAMKTAAKAAI